MKKTKKINSLGMTQEQFNRLNTSDNWYIDEVPKIYWSQIPGIIRQEDTISIMGSATYTNPVLMNNLLSYAGIDLLVHETHPVPG
jgi:hypothetical protein